MGALFLLFLVLPAVELALLIEIGSRIGTFETIALIVVTGTIGAALARQQGFHVLRQVQVETTAGRMPAGAIVDGVMILVAGALLITPGVLTDVFGFLCLIPFTRRVMKNLVRSWLERQVANGQMHVHVMQSRSWQDDPFRPRGPGAERRTTRGQGLGDGPVYDITPERPEADADFAEPPAGPPRTRS